jgi:hypothetical protein
MNDELMFKLVNALKQHSDQPSQTPAGITISNLTIHVSGGFHIHPSCDSRRPTQQVVTRKAVSRRDLIKEIHVNAGRYFLRGQFNNRLADLFGVLDLNTASMKILRQVLEWSKAWQREVVTGTDD